MGGPIRSQDSNVNNAVDYEGYAARAEDDANNALTPKDKLSHFKDAVADFKKAADFRETAGGGRVQDGDAQGAADNFTHAGIDWESAAKDNKKASGSSKDTRRYYGEAAKDRMFAGGSNQVVADQLKGADKARKLREASRNFNQAKTDFEAAGDSDGAKKAGAALEANKKELAELENAKRASVKKKH